VIVAGSAERPGSSSRAPAPTLNEIRLQGVYSHDMNAVGPAIAIVESGRHPLEKLVTHRFALPDAEKALRTAAGEVPGEPPIKVVLVP
jgi:threonine dehydrogenase-like Zn-dependent dehydrogenase